MTAEISAFQTKTTYNRQSKCQFKGIFQAEVSQNKGSHIQRAMLNLIGEGSQLNFKKQCFDAVAILVVCVVQKWTKVASNYFSTIKAYHLYI